MISRDHLTAKNMALKSSNRCSKHRVSDLSINDSSYRPDEEDNSLEISTGIAIKTLNTYWG
jgi:hypothetical protein